MRSRHAKVLESVPVLLSGGMGTELQRRGCDTRLPLWASAALLDAPEVVRRVHADYLRAGAQVVTANTFRNDPGSVRQAKRGADHAELTRIAVRLAREAVAEVSPEHPVLVAGSVGPLGDCYRPEAVPPEDVLRAEHAARVLALRAADVDLVFCETMNTIREAVAALEAARGVMPAVVSFVCGPGGRLLSGETLADAVAAVEPLSPLAILVNCAAPAIVTEALSRLGQITERPFGGYANGRGRPDERDGWAFDGGVGDEAYVHEARRWLAGGARLVGGCCGTTPRTIARLAGALGRDSPDESVFP